MPIVEWLYYAAAAWYLAYAITSTHGPFSIFVRVREWRGGQWHGRTKEVVNIGIPETKSYVPMDTFKKDGLLDCIICLMPWLALLLHGIGANIVTDALAIAGVALWLHGYTGWRHTFS